MKQTIPDKYLNTNVRAMIGGGIVESEPEEIEEPEKEPILHNFLFQEKL